MNRSYVLSLHSHGGWPAVFFGENQMYFGLFSHINSVTSSSKNTFWPGHPPRLNTYNRWGILTLVVLIAVVVLASLQMLTPACSIVKEVNASLTVKILDQRALLGFNTDSDSLKFGAVSPGTEIRRTIKLQHSKPASVLISVRGDLASWIQVPTSLEVEGNETREIPVIADVPIFAQEGNYSGTLKFCIQNK